MNPVNIETPKSKYKAVNYIAFAGYFFQPVWV